MAEDRVENGVPQPGPAYDTGLSVAQLALQAHALGLHAHQMSGFDADALRASLGVPEVSGRCPSSPWGACPGGAAAAEAARAGDRRP